MELQTAFYIVGLVFMGLMLLIMLATVIAIFVIKSKINAIHRTIDEKVQKVTNAARIGTELLGAARKVVGKRK